MVLMLNNKPFLFNIQQIQKVFLHLLKLLINMLEKVNQNFYQH